jgi:hypothetical protein
MTMGLSRFYHGSANPKEAKGEIASPNFPQATLLRINPARSLALNYFLFADKD